MNKFTFKLEAVLKIKEFQAKKIKIRLGQILLKIKAHEDQIIVLQKEIQQAYVEQEVLMRNLARAEFISFFANLVKVKRIQIEQIKQELIIERKNYEECVFELAKARGEVKVFEKMKLKKWERYKKQMLAKSYLEIEEINNIHKLTNGK